tara:strand:- start:245 stop:640 length:396 start_codon:yes stop_codon:yes gene_type:complete
MSYTPLIPDGSNPFAQTINTTGDLSFVSGRFNSVSETWLQNDYGNNGHSFTGNGFIFGSFQPASNCITSFNIYSNTNKYTTGEFINYPNSSYAVSDDEAVAYGNNTERLVFSGTTPADIKINSRINVIRIE